MSNCKSDLKAIKNKYKAQIKKIRKKMAAKLLKYKTQIQEIENKKRLNGIKQNVNNFKLKSLSEQQNKKLINERLKTKQEFERTILNQEKQLEFQRKKDKINQNELLRRKNIQYKNQIRNLQTKGTSYPSKPQILSNIQVLFQSNNSTERRQKFKDLFDKYGFKEVTGSQQSDIIYILCESKNKYMYSSKLVKVIKSLSNQSSFIEYYMQQNKDPVKVNNRAKLQLNNYIYKFLAYKKS